MELPGTTYLQTLATISITFSGFAALVAVFRQTVGGRLSDFDMFFIHQTLLRSFIVAGCSMLPLLLVLYEISHSIIWRVSSLITGLLLILFTLTLYLRRLAVSAAPLSKAFVVNSLMAIFTAVFLVMIASGIILEPVPGHFAIAVTVIMLTAVIGYLNQLHFVLHGFPGDKRPR